MRMTVGTLVGVHLTRPAGQVVVLVFFFSSRRRHTRSLCDWSSDVCSSDLHFLGNPRCRREQNGATTFPGTTVFLATARPCVAVRATKKEISEDHDEERLGLR